MMAVILQPAGDPHAREHYADTVATPVPQDRLARFLDADDLDEIGVLYGSDAVATWGVTPGLNEVNRRKWERISNGDVALMVRDGQVFVSARVTYKTRNEPLADDLWGRNEQGQTWEYLYFLDDVTPQALLTEQLNAVVGYRANARVQGFNILDESKSAALIDALALDGAFPHVRRARRSRPLNRGWREPPEVDDALTSVEEAAGRDLRRHRRRLTAAERTAIESLAVNRATEYFEADGWRVQNVGARASYDLRGNKGDARLHVEVKGTTSHGERIVLTRNELAHARGTEATLALFVLVDVTLSLTADGPVATGGKPIVFLPWVLEDSDLEPVGYEYWLPENVTYVGQGH